MAADEREKMSSLVLEFLMAAAEREKMSSLVLEFLIAAAQREGDVGVVESERAGD